MDCLKIQPHDADLLQQPLLAEFGDTNTLIEQWQKNLEESFGSCDWETAQGVCDIDASPSSASFGQVFDVKTPESYRCAVVEPPSWWTASYGPPSFDQQFEDLGFNVQDPTMMNSWGPPSPTSTNTASRNDMERQVCTIGALRDDGASSSEATASREKLKCTYPNCQKAFSREEHRKRHHQA